MSIVPIRTSQLHVNLTGILNTTMGVTAVGVPSEHDPLNGIFTFDITLSHPFATKPQLAGFDVKGVLITPGTLLISPLVFAQADETQLLNADGFTRWWNPTEFTSPGMFGYTKGSLTNSPTESLTATINPYKYFADALGATDNLDAVSTAPLDADDGRSVFTAGSSNTRRYRIKFPMDPGPKVVYGYAVDASWNFPSPNPPNEIPDDFPINANQPEAYRIDIRPVLNNLYFDTETGASGGSFRMYIDVYDWQGQQAGNVKDQVSVVRVYSPNIYPDSIEATFVEETFGKAVYFVELMNGAAPVKAGKEVIVVRVGSNGGPPYDQGVGPAPTGNISA
ncbi:MAG TPA: hypothetical protein ENN67_05940, partial [Firmicutes bacterium]|nr:hypothetical protein [Bacillota bacterium]